MNLNFPGAIPESKLQIIRSTSKPADKPSPKLDLIKEKDGDKIKNTNSSLEQDLKLIQGEEKKVLEKVTTGLDQKKGVADRMMTEAGIDKSEQAELGKQLQEYNVTLSSENLRIAGEYAKSLPKNLDNRSEIIALLIARNLPIASASKAAEYLSGSMRFSKIFADIDKTLLQTLKNAWGEGQMLEALKRLLAEGSDAGKAAIAKALKPDKFLSQLIFQEIASLPAKAYTENQIYFQWPLFWNDSDVPDTLEGEAFVPDSKDSEQGFGLRLIANPPILGQIEIVLSSIKQNLNITFGVEPKSLEPIKNIFEAVREKLLSLGDFKSVSIAVKQRHPTKNFFAKEQPLPEPKQQTYSGLNIKA